LKAAQYAVDVWKSNRHNLVQNSLRLDDSELNTLSRNLECLVGDSTRMRYPDQLEFPRIPKDVYSEEMAGQALALASEILERVRSKVF